jgi:hypothetical protein
VQATLLPRLDVDCVSLTFSIAQKSQSVPVALLDLHNGITFATDGDKELLAVRVEKCSEGDLLLFGAFLATAVRGLCGFPTASGAAVA